MTGLERDLAALWWGEEAGPRRPGLRLALAAAEAGFRAAVALRGALHAARLAGVWRAGAPVVSVGGLVAGGSGKTPAVLALGRRLLARGRRVAILSRGYGAAGRGPRIVSAGGEVLLDGARAGDEPLLLARRLPGARVLCGPDRAALAARAVAELGADALLLDDGFQHRGLARDLDLVVLDAAAPSGNGRLLPRGPNREPWAALRRADLAWLSRVERAHPAALEALRARVRDATGREPVEARQAVTDVLDGALARSFGVDALRGRRVLMLCAIARPARFRATLEGLGADVALERTFRDHHLLDPEELGEALGAAEAAGCDAVATTEKDAARLTRFWAADPRWRVVRVEAVVERGGEALEALLDRALARAQPVDLPPPAGGCP